MPNSISYPDAGEFRIRRSGEDWQAIKLGESTNGWLTVQQVASFPAKVTIGEPTKGSHPMLSTWAFSGLTSGSGVAVHDATTSHRYRIALAETRNGHFFNSPVKVQSYDGPTAFMPHNDLVVSSARRLYGSYGTDLYIWDENTLTWTDTTQNLSAAAYAPGVAFDGTAALRLYIPCGSTGYAYWDGTTLTNVAASGSQPGAKEFVVLGTKLIALSTSGQLWWSIDGSTWTSYGVYGKLPAGLQGWHLRVYKNGYGDKTVHISTDAGLYAFDPVGPTLYDTDLAQNPHPSLGRAMDRWRDQLYLGGGMGVRSWNASAVNPMGLDRDHGLPNAYRGSILDLCGELNQLFALVYAAGTTYHSLHSWTGEGWQMLWQGDGTKGLNPMVVSSAQGGYRLWWGFDDDAMSLPLPPDDANAEQQAEALTGVYERDWFMETGRTYFEMEGFEKIAVAIAWEEFTADDGVLNFQYRTNTSNMAVNNGWRWPSVDTPVYPASSSTVGAWFDRSYQFGLDLTDGRGRFYGEPFEWIEFRFFGNPGVPWAGPDIMRNVVFTFEKVIEGYHAWSLSIDLNRCREMGQEDIAALIDQLVLSNEYCDFQYQKDIYRVKFGSWGGADETGQANHNGIRNVSIIEITNSP